VAAAATAASPIGAARRESCAEWALVAQGPHLDPACALPLCTARSGTLLELQTSVTSLASDAQRRLKEHSAALERSIAKGASGAASRELAETQAALDRIDHGTYGRCESCGGAIGRQRLLALPAARFCIDCGPSR
jgi:RNA polymerase-binding transcription factor DksA